MLFSEHPHAFDPIRNRTSRLDQGKTQVINPETELAGDDIFEERLTSNGLNLTIHDVPHLSKYLREDWLMPTITFWRNFHPSRTVNTTRPMFAAIINQVAGKDICKVDGWDKLTDVEIDQEIDRINQLARSRSAEDQLVRRLFVVGPICSA